MPRKPRMESEEGIYHVINRGNYRKFIFETEGAKKAFEGCLFEACERFGWELLAYCVLSNHFHLCLGTPRGNLSEGMRWLGSTFAARFNRYRGESGHLFQGRFKALIVEPGDAVVTVVNYIHLNAARAGLTGEGGCCDYRWSSLYFFPKRARRPRFLSARWQSGVRGGGYTPAAWRRYKQLLETELTRDPKEVERLEKTMTRGWCIGSPAFKKAVTKDHFESREILRLEHEDLNEVNRLHWEMLLDRCLKRLGKGPKDIAEARFSVAWKLAIATKLKRESSVSNRWLSEALNMGVPNAVSNNCGRYMRERECDCEWAKQLKEYEL